MFRINHLIPALALALVTGLTAAGRADTVTTIQQSGQITADGINGISVYVQATQQTFANPAYSPSTSGKVIINGITGSLGVSIGANIASAAFDTEPVNGKMAHAAHFVTQRFYFRNMLTGLKALATAQIDVSDGSPTGTVCFVVHDALTGNVLAETSDKNGVLLDMPLYRGQTQMKSFSF